MYIKYYALKGRQEGKNRQALIAVHWWWWSALLAVGWWWWCRSWWLLLDGGGGGGSIHGWLLMAVCGGCWWCLCRHVGGAGHSSSFVGGAAGHSMLVVRVVIGRCCSLFVVVCHCIVRRCRHRPASFHFTWWCGCWRASGPSHWGGGNKVGGWQWWHCVSWEWWQR